MIFNLLKPLTTIIYTIIVSSNEVSQIESSNTASFYDASQACTLGWSCTLAPFARKKKNLKVHLIESGSIHLHLGPDPGGTSGEGEKLSKHGDLKVPSASDRNALGDVVT